MAARRVLCRYGLTFGRDVCGRPVAVGAPGVGVSISHSGGVLLIGLAAGCRVGVDVEPLAERGLARLPAHALTTAELREAWSARTTTASRPSSRTGRGRKRY